MSFSSKENDLHSSFSKPQHQEICSNPGPWKLDKSPWGQA